ncbi:FAD-dependent monooxygenase [Actinophytocola sp.]|uniref:FAD-dependent monooxygenase n=1 Tax=Actinophytocola sp. TaxID=1872138 RepID=UPI002ED07339
MTDAERTDVLVVGAGPVGALLALELARHGVSSVLVDRAIAASRHPKMDFLNGRSMELLRRHGLVEEIRRRGVGAEHAFDFLWLIDYREPPVARWHYPAVAQVQERMASVNDGSMPLEPYQRVLGSRLEELGRQRVREQPRVDFRPGVRFTGLSQESDGVTADLVTDTGAEVRVLARFVVGCDGANSTVRSAADITMNTVGPTAWHRDVYFRSADPVLRKYGRFFLSIVGRGVTLVSRDEQHTWTATFPITDDERSAGTPSDPLAVVRERMGVDFAVDEIIDVAEWYGELAVADSYRAGRVFLAGDAAHHFYPTGGHGANTGLADAVDLGWKLAAAVNGWAGPGLLDSYAAERRPVALFNREMCFNLLEVWGRFPRLVHAGASRAQLAGFLAEEEHQIDNVGIHFGYRYESSPVVWSEPGTAPDWRWRHVVPTTWPGGRAPSVRLPGGRELLDCLGPDFTLVDTSGDGSGTRLVAEANSRGLPTAYVAVNSARVAAVWERSLVLIRPDQHVAWRGDIPPDDWPAVVDHVRGGAPCTRSAW